MKKAAFIAFLSCIFCLPLSAQTRAFDNFDRSGGVPIVVSAVMPPAPKSADKKLVKRTGKSQAGVQDGLGMQAYRAANYKKLLMKVGSSLKGFTTGDVQVDAYIVDSSRRYAIDPLLIYSQMHQESSFKIRATSHKGASGLMQLMPATARRMGVTKIYDPKQNIEGGVKYMRWLLDTFNGDVVLALAGYNAGEGAVMKYGWNVPPYRETQEYVRRISARYHSISNPLAANSIRKISSEQAAKLAEKEPVPLSLYERDALAVKLPDGKMRLVTQ